MTALVTGAAWNGLIVFSAANNWDDVKMADRHWAEVMTEHAPVIYVDPPLSHLTPLNRPDLAPALRGPRLRQVAPRLARFTPVMPPRGEARGLSPISRRLVRAQLGSAIGSLGGSVAALVTAMPRWPMFGVCGEGRRVFWAQDDYAGGAALMGLASSRVLAAELRTARAAGTIVASSPGVAEIWRQRGYAPELIPFGCDARFFATAGACARPVEVTLAPPIAGFVGHLNDRIDLCLLEEVVDRGLSLLLVGPRSPQCNAARLTALLGRPNVQWVGPQSFADLPAYFGAIDVGLVPYTRSAFNIGSFPLKTLEYLSAGVPVVASDLPSTRWLATDLVAIDSSREGFGAAALGAAGSRRQPEAIARRQRFAAQHDWARRAVDWASLLGLGAAAGVATVAT